MWVLGKNGAWRRGPACDPNVEPVSRFQKQLTICAQVVAVALQQKIQPEGRLQGPHIHPPNQVMQMKVDEEHRVVPVDKQGDVIT